MTQLEVKSVKKQDLIQKVATGLFNSQGIGRVSLAVVAKETGMSRATLYHYVRNREELVFQCYMRSVALASKRLNSTFKLNPLEKILHYIESSLSDEADDEAIIADTGLLSQENRERLEIALHNHYQELETILAEGIETKSISRCDTKLLSRIIPNMLSFIRQSPRWTEDSQSNRRLNGVIDIAKFGIATNRNEKFSVAVDVNIFSRLKIAGFDKDSLSAMRKEQLLMTGSMLINRRGVENISLEDVADALGVTRGGVYHYFKDKPKFISECIERGLGLYNDTMSFVENYNGSGLEKSVVGLHLNTQAQLGSLQPFLPWNSLDFTQEEQREKVISGMQSLMQRSERIADIGLKDKSRRLVDPVNASLMGAGAYLTIPKWIDEFSECDTFKVIEEIINFVIYGLAPK